jgi:hypothetical protein
MRGAALLVALALAPASRATEPAVEPAAEPATDIAADAVATLVMGRADLIAGWQPERLCSTSLVEDARGEVRWVTAAHCLGARRMWMVPRVGLTPYALGRHPRDLNGARDMTSAFEAPFSRWQLDLAWSAPVPTGERPPGLRVLRMAPGAPRPGDAVALAGQAGQPRPRPVALACEAAGAVPAPLPDRDSGPDARRRVLAEGAYCPGIEGITDERGYLGLSGGPALDAQGRWLGVITAALWMPDQDVLRLLWAAPGSGFDFAAPALPRADGEHQLPYRCRARPTLDCQLRVTLREGAVDGPVVVLDADGERELQRLER